ncbi:hypothetical protein L1887_06569 [Cichorium endivia]|nr:hypothetical protein L1887_06569 [Cichorium endivia]
MESSKPDESHVKSRPKLSSEMEVGIGPTADLGLLQQQPELCNKCSDHEHIGKLKSIPDCRRPKAREAAVWTDDGVNRMRRQRDRWPEVKNLVAGKEIAEGEKRSLKEKKREE